MTANNGNNGHVKKILLVASRLCAICAVSVISLVLINALTKPRIATNEAANEKAAIAELTNGGTPGDANAVSDKTVDAIVPVYAKAGSEDISGYVLALKAQAGSGGIIRLMTAYKPSGEVIDVRVLDDNGAPGLGKGAEDRKYLRQFIGRGGSENAAIPRTIEMPDRANEPPGKEGRRDERTTKPANPLARFVTWMFGNEETPDVDSVAGATITCAAVADALYEGSEYVKKLGSVRTTAGDNQTGSAAPANEDDHTESGRNQ